MEIKDKDLGKIVQLPIRPEWGQGVIMKIENRIAHIRFIDSVEKAPKKYLRTANPLILAKDQDQPGLIRRARSKKVITDIRSGPERPKGSSAHE